MELILMSEEGEIIASWEIKEGSEFDSFTEKEALSRTTTDIFIEDVDEESVGSEVLMEVKKAFKLNYK